MSRAIPPWRTHWHIFSCIVLAGNAIAQNGDRPDEVQTELPPELPVPAAPALVAEEELQTFSLPEGLTIELVAAEPLVHDPIAARFDALGQLWVVEMRAFMPDVDGRGERAPSGTIAVLRDLNGDGRMDERRTFLDKLVLPRAVAPTLGGALVLAPPHLLECRDEDGDGYAERVEVVDFVGNYGIESPEHAVNGLVFGADGAFACANHPAAYFYDGQKWVRQRTTGGGQWGLARDDAGRFFFNTNSDPLRADFYLSKYAALNPAAGAVWGVNQRLVLDFSVWPTRMTPGVNRGYQAGILREDYRLASVTAACGPLIYRGEALGAPWKGNAFVCEPAGNLIKRYLVHEHEQGVLSAENAWAGREFLTSSDERFRPVNLLDGPDGALYVVDMYRGLIQHRLFVTTFLRKQVLARALEEPRGLGRIWRIRPAAWERPNLPKLEHASWTEVAALLAHPSGWWRDAAQQLLLEQGRGEPEAVSATTTFLLDPSTPALGRLHAWWTLTALGATRREHIVAGITDENLDVRIAVVRASETWLARGDTGLVTRWIEHARQASPRLRWQILQSLGMARTPQADAALLRLMEEFCESAELRSIALSSLGGRELEQLERVLASEAWRVSTAGRSQWIAALARALVSENLSARLERALELAAVVPVNEAWQAEALIVGLMSGRGKNPMGEPASIALAREPQALAALRSHPAAAVAQRAQDLIAALRWPGRTDVPQERPIRPLTAEEEAQFERGRFHYLAVCAACHQPSGRGEPGKAPSLRGSEWVLGRPDRLASLVLGGLEGELVVDGEQWNMEMPAFAESNEIVASVLAYIRREWGHGADPVTPAIVEAARNHTRERKRPWTAAELKAVYE